MKCKSALPVFITAMLACCTSMDKPVIANFNTEFNSFIDQTSNCWSKGTCYIILFNDVPDSTVSFILSKHPHKLESNPNGIKVKTYTKDNYDLVVCAPNHYLFEYLLQDWKPSVDMIFNDNEVCFIQRTEYVIREGMLHICNQKETPVEFDSDVLPDEFLEPTEG